MRLLKEKFLGSFMVIFSCNFQKKLKHNEFLTNHIGSVSSHQENRKTIENEFFFVREV